MKLLIHIESAELDKFVPLTRGAPTQATMHEHHCGCGSAHTRHCECHWHKLEVTEIRTYMFISAITTDTLKWCEVYNSIRRCMPSSGPSNKCNTSNSQVNNTPLLWHSVSGQDNRVQQKR